MRVAHPDQVPATIRAPDRVAVPSSVPVREHSAGSVPSAGPAPDQVRALVHAL